jgi:hypothetical protein
MSSRYLFRGSGMLIHVLSTNAEAKVARDISLAGFSLKPLSTNAAWILCWRLVDWEAQ